jgi:hypothetical protein
VPNAGNSLTLSGVAAERGTSQHRNRAVVVAVIAVTVVQPAIDQVVEVVAVRDQFVATALVIAGAGHGSTGHRIGDADGDGVLVVVALMGVVQVAIVEVIDVAFMFDAGVPTGFAVNVGVLAVLIALRHGTRLRGERFRWRSIEVSYSRIRAM